MAEKMAHNTGAMITKPRRLVALQNLAARTLDRQTDRVPATASLAIPLPPESGAPAPLQPPSGGNSRPIAADLLQSESPRPRSNVDRQQALAAGDRSLDAAAFFVQRAWQKRMKRRALRELRATAAIASRQSNPAALAAGQPVLRPATRPAPEQGFGTALRSSCAKALQRARIWILGIMPKGSRHG